MSNENDKGKISDLINYWLEKSWESFDAARSEYKADRFTTAIRSIYYACFYSLIAVLLKKKKKFKKHSAVRSALHRDLIKTGLIDKSWGQFYDQVFDSRIEGDYQPMIYFDPDDVDEFIKKAEGFIKEMENLLDRS